MEMVRLVNKDKTTFKDMYDSVPCMIAAGSEAFVPFDAMALWFGDPRAHNAGRERWRTDEYERLRTRYGTYHDEEAFAAAVPNIEAYTLDGERIVTVAEDPEGVPTRANVSAFPVTADPGEMAGQIAAMQRQLGQLMTALGQLPDEVRDQVVAIAQGAEPEPITVTTAKPAPTPTVKKVAEPPMDKPTGPKVR